MLHDPARHEPLRAIAWDEDRVRATIAHIVDDTEERFTPERCWPLHPLDADGGKTEPDWPLYHGACGVIWALHHLEATGAARLRRHYGSCIASLLTRNASWLASFGGEPASYLMGETGIRLLECAIAAAPATADRLAALIASNVDHPARELMWGAPGTLLAALFLHRHTAQERWADLYRATARRLRSQLRWSREYACHYWTQDLYGQRCTYLDAVHGFVATALPLIGGRDLLGDDWPAWQAAIVETVRATATREGTGANWPAWLETAPGRAPPKLMQFCHGAPGFVVCLAGMPDASLDDLLEAAGEAVWAAGPLAKGSNLCHGTGGNGYAFLELHARTGSAHWLERARAFAMHAIEQTHDHARRYGQMRYSLWTGDLGFACYLRDCIDATAHFPTLDTYFSA